MNTTLWGPPAWVFLHTVAQNYEPTPENKAHMKQFFTLLQHVLPCRWCRESYARFIVELPIDGYLDTQQGLQYWLYKIHNKVNDKLRMQGHLPASSKNPSFQSVCQHYERFRAACSHQTMSCRRPPS